jgi:hypothetical protein
MVQVKENRKFLLERKGGKGFITEFAEGRRVDGVEAKRA